jgi:hypothetical protein
MALAAIPPTVYIPHHTFKLVQSIHYGTDPYVGYRALWMKVIIRAAFDWVSYRDSMRLDQKKEADKAHKWLFKPSAHFNSFENICHLVDLPHDKIRDWVSTLTKEHVAKIEHLERESSTNQIALVQAELRLIEEMGD